MEEVVDLYFDLTTYFRVSFSYEHRQQTMVLLPVPCDSVVLGEHRLFMHYVCRRFLEISFMPILLQYYRLLDFPLDLTFSVLIHIITSYILIF